MILSFDYLLYDNRKNLLWAFSPCDLTLSSLEWVLTELNCVDSAEFIVYVTKERYIEAVKVVAAHLAFIQPEEPAKGHVQIIGENGDSWAVLVKDKLWFSPGAN